jgi:hypothetical protein
MRASLPGDGFRFRHLLIRDAFVLDPDGYDIDTAQWTWVSQSRW